MTKDTYAPSYGLRQRPTTKVDDDVRVLKERVTQFGARCKLDEIVLRLRSASLHSPERPGPRTEPHTVPHDEIRFNHVCRWEIQSLNAQPPRVVESATVGQAGRALVALVSFLLERRSLAQPRAAELRCACAPRR